MQQKREKLNNSGLSFSKVIKSLASIKLTVICLLILLLLVVWGTVYQADHGLYQAQQKFFHSWIFLIGGFIPFPGTVMVMFVLFLNLIFSIIYRIGFRLSNIGNLITHLGLIFLMVGSFLIYTGSEESSLIIKEGQEVNASISRSQWEIALWKQESGKKQIYAFDSNDLALDEIIPLGDLGFTIQVKGYYKNCRPFNRETGNTLRIINSSGIKDLEKIPNFVEQYQNTPGCVLDISSDDNTRQTVLLYGRDRGPTPIRSNNQIILISLRRKKILMPFKLKLLDFKKVMYPNSNITKSFESKLTLTPLSSSDGLDRDVIISMNKPLRFGNLTIFQSGYNKAEDGTELTILAVVKSSARLFPYFSSILIFLGLVIHFIIMLIRNTRKRRTK